MTFIDQLITDELITALTRMAAASFAGGLIGLERSYNGRPAGFRTHSLVCLASSVLMLLTVFQWELLADAPLDTIRVDPTRMAQGIMTGIGFLGAGVIMKEVYTVRGLTTAASIWITAAIGIIIGMGMYDAAVVATLFALGTLTLFRWFESKLPALQACHVSITTTRNSALTEDDILAILKKMNLSPSSRSYHSDNNGIGKRYEMTVYTRHDKQFRGLAELLSQNSEVREFSVTPISR